jgi:hypothetical protein
MNKRRKNDDTERRVQGRRGTEEKRSPYDCGEN